MHLTSILFIALIGIITGFLMGILINSLRDRAEPSSPAVEDLLNQELHNITEQDPDLKEIIRIWRDKSGVFIPEMDGEQLKNSSDLKSTQREHLHQIVNELSSWLILPQTQSTAHNGTTSVGSSMDGEVKIPTLKPEKPRFSLTKSLTRALQSDIPKVTSSPTSIAAQIDAILQEKLKDSPLADQPIRLMEFPGKDMVVLIGLNKYDGIDAVPDEDVKALIRASVAEWEEEISN